MKILEQKLELRYLQVKEIEQYPLIYTKVTIWPLGHTMGNIQQKVGTDKIFGMVPAEKKRESRQHCVTISQLN
jgi:hypothetical protein